MKISILVLGLAGTAALGCASAPAAPFDTLKSANVQAFRLQNYEPPAAATTPAAGAPAAIPGIPPEIMQMAQQALPGLQQFLPPGLIPPNLLQGGAAAAPQVQTQPDAPRFPQGQPNFRILGQAQVIDPDLKEELAKVLGDPDNFQAAHANCLYAELGISFSNGAALNDLLISFSCNQVEARSFAWPHPNRGLKPDTVKKIVSLSQKIWPGG